MKAQNNKEQMTNVKKEIEQALTSDSISFEDIPEEGASPLNQPVVEKDSNFQGTMSPMNGTPNAESSETGNTSDNPEPSHHDGPLDAPEQEIDPSQLDDLQAGDEPEIPLAHAQIAADTFLGITDNLLEVGGGFFVRIRKHEDFYEFDEVVQVIDEQNQKNLKRIKLDDEDRALLRPLLVMIIRRRAKRLTPEQQLAGAVISILIKKARMAAEIRAENNQLVDRIRDIIKQESADQPETPSSGFENKAEPKKDNEQHLASVLEVAE